MAKDESPRSLSRSGENTGWNKVSFVNGNGNSQEINNYSYSDKNLQAGKYNYRLKQIDFNGNYEYFELVNDVTVGVPEKFELVQNYPNPFNPSTVISYNLAEGNFISLKIYNELGKEVAALVNERQNAGSYSISFDGSNLPSGLYYYKLESGGFVDTKKMLLIK